MSSSLSFPTLSDEDLVALCVDVVGRTDIPITPAAIKNPTMESAMTMFKFFIDEVIGWDIDRALTVPFDPVSQVQFPEMHQEQTPLLRFYGAIFTFLARIHCDDFGIIDIVAPRTKRLRRQLSALANFALHYQKMMDDYGEDVIEAQRRARLRSDRLAKENRDLKSNIHKGVEREEEIKQVIHQEQQLVEERTQEICALQEQKEALLQETRQTMASIGRVKDQIQAIGVEEAKLNEEKESVESRLVGSPEKVRQTLARAREDLKALEEQLKTVSMRQQELHCMHQHMAELEERLAKLRQKHDVLSGQAGQHSASTSEIKEVAGEMEDLLLETSQLQSTNRQLSSRCQMIEESRESQMLKNEHYLEAKKEELENRTQVLERARSELASHRQLSAELAAQMEQLKRRLQEDAGRLQQRLAALDRQEADLGNAVTAVIQKAARSQRQLLQHCQNGLLL